MNMMNIKIYKIKMMIKKILLKINNKLIYIHFNKVN